MTYLTQKTLKNNVSFSGVALHNGLNVNVCIKPAEVDFGIVFKRVDVDKNNLVYPNFLNVTNTSLNTTIENEHGVKISTIEHLMGSLFGLGIDNALIEIDNEEVPILDGSAKVFIEKIISAGIKKTNSPIKITVRPGTLFVFFFKLAISFFISSLKIAASFFPSIIIFKINLELNIQKLSS